MESVVSRTAQVSESQLAQVKAAIDIDHFAGAEWKQVLGNRRHRFPPVLQVENRGFRAGLPASVGGAVGREGLGAVTWRRLP